MTRPSTLLDRTRQLVAASVQAYGGHPVGEVIRDVAARMDEPLRVAIAGRVKAGKSTLLNGLIGQEIAATDAGECTKIVTWFQDGPTYRVTAHPKTGMPRQLPFGGGGSLADLDLGRDTPETVQRLVVDWPSQRLRAMTLIDTPGMGSVNVDISNRTRDMLTPDGPRSPEADAVVYLMRHMHGDDVAFLEAFHETDRQGKPVNTVGVLARADEVGHSRVDALDSARRIAARYQSDPRVRRLCHSVVPVAGLLASCAATLRESEYQTLARIAALPDAARRRLLISTDRFISLDTQGAVDPKTRIELLKRVGLFGVRNSLEMITAGQVHNATELAAELERLSGIGPLRELLATQFSARAAVLKARTALIAMESVFQASPPPPELQRRIEELRAGAHELTELRLIDALREDPTLLPDHDATTAERLLGCYGGDWRSRLGLAPDAVPTVVRSTALGALGQWQRVAEDPISARATQAAARILVRTCEGMLAAG